MIKGSGEWEKMGSKKANWEVFSNGALKRISST